MIICDDMDTVKVGWVGSESVTEIDNRCEKIV